MDKTKITAIVDLSPSMEYTQVQGKLWHYEEIGERGAKRLIAYLKEKQRLSGSSVIKASHYLIADELATSRVVISRLLKQLENNKKIILYRNEIKLLASMES